MGTLAVLYAAVDGKQTDAWIIEKLRSFVHKKLVPGEHRVNAETSQQEKKGEEKKVGNTIGCRT